MDSYAKVWKQISGCDLWWYHDFCRDRFVEPVSGHICLTIHFYSNTHPTNKTQPWTNNLLHCVETFVQDFNFID